MIKAVLFDMDGVIFDSMPYHVQAWHETMQQYIPDSVPEDFYLFEGRTGASTIDILFNRNFQRDATDEEKQSIYAQKAKRFNELDDARAMAGALNVLKKVKENNIQIVLVTGSGQQSLLEKLNTYFPGFFSQDKMITAYDVKFGKPHPEPYLLGLEKAGIKPEEAIVVENAPLGVESAVAAGIYTIAVNTGPLPDKILSDAGANCICPSMQALADDFEQILDQLNK